mmetsp:Transcript_7950/g.26412  ORF Transcript_7950/g.26412 Transcript_7950/m.26412 type:complete len:287 (-) Transcript_7950:120-980(-)
MRTRSKPCSSAKRRRSGRRAISPSESRTTSERTPTGAPPASRERSTAASVWPPRLSTPPARERSGKMCPGRRRSAAVVRLLASARTVCERSAAEMPVVDASKSHVTVNAVDIVSVLLVGGTISGSSNASARSSSIDTHTTPDVCRTMKAIASGVTRSAAIIRSPSFSRSSSSNTTTNRPAAISANASGMLANPGVGASAPSTSAGASGCHAGTDPSSASARTRAKRRLLTSESRESGRVRGARARSELAPKRTGEPARARAGCSDARTRASASPRSPSVRPRAARV